MGIQDRLFTISRTTETGPKSYKSTNVVVLGQNMYNAFGRFSDTAQLPAYAACDEIGHSKNPCVRYILPDGTRYYVRPGGTTDG